ncbi:MAG: PQQ-dependent sugar dehydrogenase [Saprospiraceae bacterium]|nr:PQQ-dependent sugar dehydrogenase [Saprospiraceae bacterium]
MTRYLFLLLCLPLFQNCKTDSKAAVRNYAQPIDAQTDPELAFLNIPEGFALQVYADSIDNARSLALSPNGTLFIGSRKKSVHAVVDTDQDGRADKTYVIATGLNMPNGVAFKDGDLYVAEVSRVLKFEDIESRLADNLEYDVIYDEYPTEKHHGWKYIAFGPDEKLYVPVGAPCNICESDDRIFNTITRMDDDGSNMEIVQEGVRNTVGFNWHPTTGELWFTDNGRDWMGEDMPACELNHAPKDNMHFGYPYCHQGDTPDPEFGEKRACEEFTAPVQNLGPHTAPLGLEFYHSGNFPGTYKNTVFIAEHGSWNRTVPIGYRITMVDLDGTTSLGYEPFLDGFRDNEANELYGRPVDLEWMPDGSMLISDDYANKVYRLIYTG